MTAEPQDKISPVAAIAADTAAEDTVSDMETERPHILVADPIASEGMTLLRGFADVDERPGLIATELTAAIPAYDALVVRSETRVTAEVIAAGARLRVIARAGVGVDNIDVDAATRHGVIVINSPTGNIAAAAEHTVALLLALARHIPAASASLREGRWERSHFVGTEVRGKTLGIVGLGKVGAEVARRAGEGGLGMRLLASDPYASPETARKLNAELIPLEELLAQADFVTIHTALTGGTRGLIGSDELALMKPTARIINCARGGIVDEEALLVALESGALAGAALDVYSKEPPGENATLHALIKHPHVVATPHLGASTEEAQISVAVDVVEQVEEILRGGAARAAVNAPMILPETMRQLQPWVKLVEKLGRLYTQLHPGPLRRAELSVSGEIASYDTRPLSAALVKGLLESVSEAHVNLVNAPVVARDWGLEIVESRSTTAEQYSNLVTIRVAADGPETPSSVLSATITWGEERVVRVDRYATDFSPSGHILIARNLDRPGMVGRVGTILGEAGVNISHMDVGPVASMAGGRTRQAGGEALMILSLDGPVPEDALERIDEADGIFAITSVVL
ncbi:MAG TPA: phosphoglycerate dehydrogenase [Ktedonobacterales bacterium]|nr:phosphoglycerate dehydrogenase [Ktedonobacterales bacterium]